MIFVHRSRLAASSAARQVFLLLVVGQTCLALNIRPAFAHPLQDVPTTEASAPEAPVASRSPQVYNWQDVPEGEKVPVKDMFFDGGGYQIVCSTGDKIVVPFVNETTNVMKFGRSETEDCYFVKDGTTPVLYLNNTGYLQNAAVQDARWYPIPPDYAYSAPLTVGLAPTWNAYNTMGWYPGMTVYGGVVSNTRGTTYIWMPGYRTVINGTDYPSYLTYLAYMTRHVAFLRNRVYFTNYNTRTGQVWGSIGVTNSQGAAGIPLPLRSLPVQRSASAPSAPVPFAKRSASAASLSSVHSGVVTRPPSKPVVTGGAGVMNRSSGMTAARPPANVPAFGNRNAAPPRSSASAPSKNVPSVKRKH